MEELTDRMMSARCRLITKYAFYGCIAAMFRWIPVYDKSKVKTMGVAIVDAEVYCFYNVPWCNTLTTQQLMGVIKHEVEHIVKLHPLRLGSRHPRNWNIATDSIINGKIGSPRIEEINTIHEKFQEYGKSIIFMPNEVDDNITSEEMYEWYITNQQKFPQCQKCGGHHPQPDPNKKKDKKGSGKGDKKDKDGKGDKGDKGEGGDKEGKGEGDHGDKEGKKGCGGDKDGDACHGDKKGKGGGKGEKDEKSDTDPDDPWADDDDEEGGCTLDDHGMWGMSNTSEDEAKQLVRDMVKHGLSAGDAPNHLTEDIKRLEKPRVSWRNELHQWIGRHVGNKRRTYARIPRKKENAFGLKGISSHARIALTILVDTSGSVDSERLKVFFSEIESISMAFKIVIIEFTWAANGHYTYRKGDWKKIKVKDRGGTNFDAALNYMEQNNLVGKINIMLTDGECTIPAERKYPMLWAICSHQDYHKVSKNFTWGKTIEIPKYGL